MKSLTNNYINEIKAILSNARRQAYRDQLSND